MAQSVATRGIFISYLRDRTLIEVLDQEMIRTDLLGSADEGLTVMPGAVTDYDHVLLAVDGASGRHVGVLVARDGVAAGQPFLLLETGFVAVPVRGRGLMQRMVAMAMLHMAGYAPMPNVLASCTANPAWFGMLRALSLRFTGSCLFPALAGQPIPLAAAGLARRVAQVAGPSCRYEAATGTLRGGKMRHGRGLSAQQPLSDDPQIAAVFGHELEPIDEVVAVLDLRGQSEDVVTEDARRIALTRTPGVTYRSSRIGRQITCPSLVR